MSNIYNELLQQELIESFPQLNSDQQLNALHTILDKYNITLISPYTTESMDLQEKIKLFLSGKKLEGLSPITLKGYKLDLSIFAKHVQKRTEDITTNDIRLYLGRFNKLKQTSIASKISVLKSFFSWLTNEEIISKDPTKKIKNPKKEKRLPKALNIEDLELIRESCHSPRCRSLLEVFYATGCRLSEVQKINKDDIDWSNMSINVIGKGDRERIVYFSYKAVYYLKKYLRLRTDNDPALFVTERRPYHRLSNRGIQREFSKILKNSGLTKAFHPHVMRSSLASLLLNNGADLSTVQEILGHSSPDTTQIYAKITEEHKQRMYKKCLIQ